MVYTYAYSYHSTFPTLLGSLYNVNHSNTKKVHKISFGIISMAYLLLTIFGFILSNKVPNEIFQEKDDFFNEDWKTIKRPFQYCLIIFLLFLIPIRFIVLRDNYITLIGKRKVTFFKELTIVGIFLLICNILVFCIAEFDEYLEKFQIKNTTQAFGGIFGVVISFVLPVINYSSVNGKKKIKSIIGYTILAFYILISIMEIIRIFYDRIKSTNDFYSGIMVSICGRIVSPLFSKPYYMNCLAVEGFVADGCRSSRPMISPWTSRISASSPEGRSLLHCIGR